jgi:hypothetical protein
LTKGDLWCSTKWDTQNGIVVQKSVVQTESSFIITESKEVSASKNKLNAAVIKGTFNCILYKVDSNEKIDLTNGRFNLLEVLEG